MKIFKIDGCIRASRYLLVTDDWFHFYVNTKKHSFESFYCDGSAVLAVDLIYENGKTVVKDYSGNIINTSSAHHDKVPYNYGDHKDDFLVLYPSNRTKNNLALDFVGCFCDSNSVIFFNKKTLTRKTLTFPYLRGTNYKNLFFFSVYRAVLLTTHHVTIIDNPLL